MVVILKYILYYCEYNQNLFYYLLNADITSALKTVMLSSNNTLQVNS
jgi:hypothetical protein